MLPETRIALITGSTRGIGRAIACTLAKQNVYIIGTATSKDGAAEFTQWLKDNDFAGIGLTVDLNSPNQIESFLTEDLPKYQAPNILIHNAGIVCDDLLLRMSSDSWQTVMNVNLNSFYRLSQYCLRPMLKAKWGRILSIGSVVARMGNAGQANYAAAKAGVEGFTRALAKEVGSRGITVNTISPGYIETSMTEKINEEVKNTILNQIPLKRFGRPDEIAAMARFLVSNDADYITGQTIQVNGGLYMN